MNENKPVSPKILLWNPWLWHMAWRDSRTHRKRLLLFMASIILGVAALVAISSLGENLEKAVDEQAKSLLGADLLLRSQEAFTPEVEAFLDSLAGAQPGAEQSREVMFGSMAYFPKNNGTRLAQIRALQGEFPYYGKLETAPASALASFRATSGGALVDHGLMLQYQLSVGDAVKIGEKTFQILGEVTRAPGQAAAGATVAPRIYIPLADLEATGLIRFGSRVFYHAYFKFAPTVDVEALVQKAKSQITRHRLRVDTVEERKEDFGEAMKNLYRFLSLVAFIALLLGCLGVASAVHVYIKQKLAIVAVLRCVGAQIKQTFYIYLIQTGMMGLIGSLAGALAGVAVQTWLPAILRDFLVVEVEFHVAWKAVLQGLLIGLGMTLLFALLPLLAIRKVSPLLAIRSSYEDSAAKARDPLRWILYGLIVLVVLIFAISQSEDWQQGAGFTAGLLAAFGLLAGTAKLIMLAVKKFFPSSWSYVWRQSLANLYRPHNQTLVLMLSLGLGTFLIATLFLTQHSLLRQVSLADSGRQPNLVLFDVQVDQIEAAEELVRSHNLPVYQTVPIVAIRLESLKGRRVEEIRADSSSAVPSWALRREYFVTYRDSLFPTEKIIAGNWEGQFAANADTIPISLEKGIAENLEVGVGDVLSVNVQGVSLPARVGSIREVNWQRVQPNFFMVFPKGVLEDAPQTFVLVTRAPSAEASAALQQAAVREFPNVSAIDLALILQTVEAILNKISFVIRFMALFSILTGLTVLVAAVITTRYQRIQESVLLRTLGAKKAQISRILTLEYFYLGGFAGLAGMLLALAAGWALDIFVFKTSFTPPLWPVAFIWIGVTGLTILLGMLNSRGIAERPPLEVLRAEV
ncbi:MAG: ABC transporter permease [Calditrichia bacterium]|nr:ABC transporter permease [Calditrichia bacterium]